MNILQPFSHTERYNDCWDWAQDDMNLRANFIPTATTCMLLCLAGAGCSSWGDPWTESLPLAERAPRAEELPARPAELLTIRIDGIQLEELA